MNKEHNFVSAVVYLHNMQRQIASFLKQLQGELEANFEQYEIICVNDASTDESVEAVRQFAKEKTFPLTIVQMSTWQGPELAMTAGIDVAIGDFVFEFDRLTLCDRPALLMECYRKALTGCDVVSACPEKTVGGAKKMFYRWFNRSFDSVYPVREDAFRLVSRRALNRVHAISATPPYRKAAYAASGLKVGTVCFSGSCKVPVPEKDPMAKALDSLALYTHVAYKFSFGFSVLMLLATVFFAIYSVVIYLSPVHQVEGWTSTMLVICFCFFGVFFMLTLVIKYLSLLVDLIFKKQRYLVEGIEKIQK